MREITKTIEEWSIEYETVILSVSGTPKGFKWETSQLTRREFLETASVSTIQFGPKIHNGLDALRYMN